MTRLDTRLGDNRRFTFKSDAYPEDSDKFSVVRMEGSEAISRPYRFELILVSDDAEVDFDLMLAKTATFSLHTPGDRPPPPSHYSGVLAEFDQLHQAGGYTFYRAVLVPKLWRLSLYRLSEVYLHEQTIPGIVETVLKNGGLSSQDFEVQTQGEYRNRSFVCQYQETHLDFISRWMEKEGMYYYFSQDGEKETLRIVDSRFIHSNDSKQLNYRPVGEPDNGLDAQSVQTFIQQRKPMPAKLVLQDYNYRKADTELRVEVEVSPNGFGEVMLYGENFRNEKEGLRYANIRKQELLCGERVFVGEATATGLLAGYFAQLSSHYRQDFNSQYLVTEVQHEGSQAGVLLAGLNTPYNQQQSTEAIIYHCSFRAIPAGTQFRAERKTPKPRIAGTMNATVDAEGSGEYAEMDEYGQYKVQIPFDYTDKAEAKASAQVRMASPYAGSDHGMHFPLIKGSEVLLSFTDGDPDQPTIVGSVPNSSNPSVINNKNQQHNLISTRGGNQMLMQDEEGKEVIWLNSPFHKSSIGIGSILPQGGGSIYEATTGGADKVSFGTNNSMSFGSSNSFALSSDASLKASISNGISMGSSISISASSGIKWNMDLGFFHKDIINKRMAPSFSIDDTSSIKVSESFGGNAHKKSIISAGLLSDSPKTIDFKKNLRWYRGVISAFTAANFAQSTIFAMAVNGSDGGKFNTGSNKKDIERKKTLQDKKKKYATCLAMQEKIDSLEKRGKLTLEEEQKLNILIEEKNFYQKDRERIEILKSQQPLNKEEEEELSLLNEKKKLYDVDQKEKQRILRVAENSRSTEDKEKLSKLEEKESLYFKKEEEETNLLNKKKKLDENEEKKLINDKKFLVENPTHDLTPEEKLELKKLEEKASEKSSKRGDLHGWPGIAGKFGLDVFVNAAGLLVGLRSAKSMEVKLKKLAYVSRIESSVDGIEQSVYGGNSPLAPGKISSFINMSPDSGISIESTILPSYPLPRNSSILSLHGKSGVAALASQNKIRSVTEDLILGVMESSATTQLGKLFIKKAKLQYTIGKLAACENENKKKPIELEIDTLKKNIDECYNNLFKEIEQATTGLFCKAQDKSVKLKTLNSGLLLQPERSSIYSKKIIDIHISDKEMLNFSSKGLHVSSTNLLLKHGLSSISMSNDGFSMSIAKSRMKADSGSLSLDGGILKLG